MKGIYLGACRAFHPDFNIVYQDIDGTRDIGGDMLDIDLAPYDFVICTPPCNFYSKANCNINSEYSIKTKHLLPCSIIKCAESHKPFLVENVINRKRFHLMGVYQLCAFYRLKVFEYGRHTYITNVEFPYSHLPQEQEFKYGGKYVGSSGYHQGGLNVFLVVNAFISSIVDGSAVCLKSCYKQLSLSEDYD